MIGILPVIYDDELLYSFLARYSVLSGYSTFRGVAEDIYVNVSNKPNVLLLNNMTDDLLNKLSCQISLRDIVMEHTMFKWFVRFAGAQRMKYAYDFAMDMNIKSLYNSLPISQYRAKYKEPLYLRFCPICSIEDRKKVGETYFKTYHQIQELKICPKHKCYLQYTPLSISKDTPFFMTAESVYNDNSDIIYSDSVLLNNLAEYILQIEQANLDINCKVHVGSYFSNILHNSKYANKKMRNMRMLTEDFNAFYSSVGIHRELWQIQKILTNYCFNAFEISLFAYFLGITAIDLCERK